MNELALFAGAGGGILGGGILGWRTICAVEWEPYAASVLAARQNDGLLPPFPIWDDVRTFDGRPWRGRVDVVSGGFPCQDISVAGKGAGIDGERSGMWAHMARIVGEVRPRYVFVENSPALLTRGLGRVLGDLAALGYDCRWTVLGAADVGAPHRRDRFWLVAHADNIRWRGESLNRCSDKKGTRNQPSGCSSAVAHADSQRQSWQQRPAGSRQAGPTGGCGEVAHADGVRQLQPQGRQPDQWGRPSDCGAEVRDAHRQGLAVGKSQPSHDGAQLAAIERADWWESEPDVGRVADGVAAGVDRLKAIGNGQVPLCAATAWRALANGHRLTETEAA